MATILTKKKDTTGAPSAGDLTNSTGGAELAVNTADKRLYTKNSGGSVVEVGTNPGEAVTFVAGSASTPAITTTGDTNTGIFFPAADTIAFAEGGAEAMRIDSSGRVGIGTSSPSTRLHLSSADDTRLTVTDSGNSTNLTIRADSTNEIYSNADFNIYTSGSNPIVFKTNNTERMRILAGGGLTFNGDTAAANALDDYEEGTWTPSLGGNTTYNGQTGTYTKVGRMVVARGNINVATLGTGSTGIVTGLPFTTATIFGVQVGYWGLTANNFVFIGGFSNSSTQINFYTATAATGTLGDGTAIFGNGTNLHFTITYFV